MMQWQKVVHVPSSVHEEWLLNDCNEAALDNVVDGNGSVVLDSTGKPVRYEEEDGCWDLGYSKQYHREGEASGEHTVEI